MDKPETEMWSVEEWLDKIGMSKYTEGFVDNGYETVELVTQMKAEDMDAVGVANKQHRGILFTQAKLLHEEATGIRPEPSPVPSKKPAAITISMSGSASPTTPSSTSGYTEPWDNTQSPIQSPLVAETAAYSEPWNSTALTPKSNGSSRAPIESTDGGNRPPPLPPPNKAIKGPVKFKSKAKKPPPSPGVSLPEYKRDNGNKKLTKLQLKLKIRDELQKDAIVLSEPPYISEDGSQNEESLVNLASDYAERFGVESLGVYDALEDVWRHTNNKTEFATPSPAPKILQGGPSDNYEEPFDTQAIPSSTSKKVSGGLTPPPKDKNVKSHTLPPTNQSNYEEPFDTVRSPDGSPEKIRSSKVELSKTLPSPKLQTKNDASKNDTSKSDTSKSDTSKSDASKSDASENGTSAAPETMATKDSPTSPPASKGLGRFFRRDRKNRSQSVKQDTSKPEEEAGKKGKKQALLSFPKNSRNKKVTYSVDNLKVSGEGEGVSRSPKSGAGRSMRASVAGYPAQNGVSHEPQHRRSSLGNSPSESEESPQQRKKHGGKLFQKFITPPTLKRNQSPEYPVSSGSDDDKTPPALRRLRQLGNPALTGSDMELDIHVNDEDSKGWMHASRSYDNLADIQVVKKSDKKKGFFKRLLTFRRGVTMPSTGRKKTKDKTRDSVISTTSSEVARENSLTSSVSMPDISSALKVLELPSAIPEDPFSTRLPVKQSRTVKHSPAQSQLGKDDDSPTNQQDPISPRIVINSAPTKTGFFSNGSASTKGSLKDDPLPMVRTGSANSAKSIESSGSFTKPPPPPKPATLTRRGTPGKGSTKEERVSSTSKTSKGSPEDHSKPVPPPKPVKLKDKPSSQSVTKAPAKPARNYKNIKILSPPPDKPAPPTVTSRDQKDSGGTEQRKEELKNSDAAPPSNQTVNKENGNSPSNDTPSPDHTQSTPVSSQGSSNSSTPTLTSAKPENSSRDQPVSTPPPKPSRNYKTIKILSPPPEKSAPPTTTSKDQSSNSESIVKPSELFRRSHSPMTESPSHTPSLSQGSEGSQDERPAPRPRSLESNPEKPHPPSKPPRKSVKLKKTD